MIIPPPKSSANFEMLIWSMGVIPHSHCLMKTAEWSSKLISPSFWDYNHTEFLLPSLELLWWQWISWRSDMCHLRAVHSRKRYYFSKISFLFIRCIWMVSDSKGWCTNRAYIPDSAHARELPTDFFIQARLCVCEQEINFYFVWCRTHLDLLVEVFSVQLLRLSPGFLILNL